jgi:hypothetical protein
MLLLLLREIEAEVARENFLHPRVGVSPGVAGVSLITSRDVDAWNIRDPILG